MGRIVRKVSLFRNMLAFWLRRHRKGAAAGRRRAVAVKLVDLDARTLRDIGLEPWRNALGARVALRRYEMRRWSASRIGLY